MAHATRQDLESEVQVIPLNSWAGGEDLVDLRSDVVSRAGPTIRQLSRQACLKEEFKFSRVKKLNMVNIHKSRAILRASKFIDAVCTAATGEGIRTDKKGKKAKVLYTHGRFDILAYEHHYNLAEHSDGEGYLRLLRTLWG